MNAKITEQQIAVLERLSLEEIMRHHGHSIIRKTPSATYYLCPFHREKSASFCILRKSEGGKQGFVCHGCGVRGSGAIDLEAHLSGQSRKSDFLDIVKRLSKAFHIEIGGEDYNSFFHRATPCAPSPEIRYDYRPFTLDDLRHLGCSVEQSFDRLPGGEYVAKVLDGKPVYKYQWSLRQSDEFPRDPYTFDPKRLETLFNLRAVERYTTESREDPDSKEQKSWVVESTPDYPVFEFRYGDKKNWWSRKYEPLFRKSGDGQSYKFTWWYSGGKRNRRDLGSEMYGDIDFMEALSTGRVKATEADHPIVQGDNSIKFRRLVLCSGPRDGMNVYFNSDAHVCWPHSESAYLSGSTLTKLREMSEELYICYDSDATGVRNANELALRQLDFRVVKLPGDLGDIISPRTGNPCKDVTDYFQYYGSKLKHESTVSNFESLLLSAKSLRFWQYRPSRRNTGEGRRIEVAKYDILIGNTLSFLPAIGMYKYEDTKGMSKIVIVRDNIVRIIPNESVDMHAIDMMIRYFSKYRMYCPPELEESIRTSAKINTRSLSQLPLAPLNFNSYGEDFDYFFFKNCAVRVTPEGWESQSYSTLPYSVNEDSIIPSQWDDSGERLFSIDYNKEYIDNLTIKHQKKLSALTNQNDIDVEKELYKRQSILYRYKLTLHRRWEDMPPVVQMLWHTCRFFWEQEERGIPMTDIQTQFCHIHFINKIGALGYFLSRHRSTRRQYMVEMTDYHVTPGKRNGRNGKSIVGNVLLPLVRKGQEIVGQNFKSRNEHIALNFNSYVQTRDSYIYIDDLNTKVPISTFINLLQRISIKTLYYNEETLSADESPKILVSHNVHFTDQDSEGTYRGRLYTMYFSDYYHEATDDGKRTLRTPESEFGDLIKDSSSADLQLTREMLAYALSFYLRENKLRGESVRIEAPLESHDEIERARRTLHNDTLWEWANVFFLKEHHYGRPISRSSMCLSYLRYRNDRLTPDKYVRLTKQTVANELDTFQRDIESYCNITFQTNKIVYNPLSVFKGAQGFDSRPNKNGTYMMRKNAWCVQYDMIADEYDFSQPRVLMNDRCYYFYKSRDVPKSEEDILQAPLTDPDADEFAEH